jgi:hypothetical protein
LFGIFSGGEFGFEFRGVAAADGQRRLKIFQSRLKRASKTASRRSAETRTNFESVPHISRYAEADRDEPYKQ